MPQRRARSGSKPSSRQKSKVNTRVMDIMTSENVVKDLDPVLKAANDKLKDIIDPNRKLVLQGPICVLTHRLKDNGEPVEHSYVVPRATNPKTIELLEWIWDMKKGTFNVHTSLNIQTLDVYLHCRFDAGDWFWVPADGPILDAMEAYYVKSGQQRANPEQFYNESTFSYRFVFFEKDGAPTVQQYQTTHKNSLWTNHNHPYTNLRLVKMHVPPHFIIFDTGKLQKVFGDQPIPAEYFSIQSSAEGNLNGVRKIYQAWMKACPVWDSSGKNPFCASSQTSRTQNSGSGAPSRAGSNTNVCSQTSQTSGQNALSKTQSHQNDADSLMPWDSASNLLTHTFSTSPDDEEVNEDEFMAEKWVDRIKEWACDVYCQRNSEGYGSDGSEKSVDSEETAVDTPIYSRSDSSIDAAMVFKSEDRKDPEPIYSKGDDSSDVIMALLENEDSKESEMCMMPAVIPLVSVVENEMHMTSYDIH
ncbi:hypothetical protein VKT23_013908 [Stygiomarasmius scandens]|uniref:Uncharacterized protein n=1 Tax=Marasmiellus scandens TaxID=2682957 RepID=A0ABR1J265_9AGAR